MWAKTPPTVRPAPADWVAEMMAGLARPRHRFARAFPCPALERRAARVFPPTYVDRAVDSARCANGWREVRRRLNAIGARFLDFIPDEQTRADSEFCLLRSDSPLLTFRARP